MSFERRDWLRAIYQDPAPRMVVKKASQVGVTELLKCHLIAETYAGRGGMYILPTKTLMFDFVKNRIKTTVSCVRMYRKAMKVVLGEERVGDRGSDSMAMIRFFGRMVKFVGSNSANDLYEFPAGWIIVDENDRCDQNNLFLALEDRTGYQETQRVMRVGNPSLPGIGIAAEFEASDQKFWMIKCPACNEYQSLKFFTHVAREVEANRFELRDPAVREELAEEIRKNGTKAGAEIVRERHASNQTDAKIYCLKCEGVIDRHAPGQWVAKHPDRIVSGYSVNKIWGDYRRIPAAVDLFRQLLACRGNPAALQRFMNNSLGEEYEGEGNQLNAKILARCMRDYDMPPALPWSWNGHTYDKATAGVDVGAVLHVHISGWRRTTEGIVRVKVFIGTCTWDELPGLCKRYNVISGVIDADPETAKAREFVEDNPGWLMCRFQYTLSDNELVIKDDESIVKVNRTEIFDESYDCWLNQFVELPIDWRVIDDGEFPAQMAAPIRVHVENSKPPRFAWEEGDKPDHHRLGDVYDLLALKTMNEGDFGGLWV